MKYTTLVLAACAVVSLHGQETSGAVGPFSEVDPFSEVRRIQPKSEPPPKKNVSICYETFSMPLAMAASMQREQLTDSAFYQRIIEMLKQAEVRQESFTVLRVNAGSQATTASVSEQIYPTEFEPSEIPQVIGIQIAPKPTKDAPRVVPDTSDLASAVGPESFDGLMTSATPTAYETRETGITLEMAPTLSEDGTIIHVSARPEHVTLVGHTISGQGLSTAKMPVFEKQSITVSASLRINQPHLLGTVSRPPVSEVDPDSANRVWFAFMTGTLSKP